MKLSLLLKYKEKLGKTNYLINVIAVLYLLGILDLNLVNMNPLPNFLCSCYCSLHVIPQNSYNVLHDKVLFTDVPIILLSLYDSNPKELVCASAHYVFLWLHNRLYIIVHVVKLGSEIVKLSSFPIF